MITYVIGFTFLMYLHLSPSIILDKDMKSLTLNRLTLLSSDVRIYILKTSGSLLLAGYLPLLASSTQLELTSHLPVIFREWIWVLENITAILASTLYLLFIANIYKKWIDSFLIMNSVCIFISLMNNGYIVIISLIVLSFTINFSFQKFRDDLLISAGKDTDLIRKYSALSQLQRNFIFFLSPLIISTFLIYKSMTFCILFIFGMQIIVFSMYLLDKRITKAKSQIITSE